MAPAKPALDRDRSQRHFLVAVGVAFDFLGGGLRPPSEPPPFDGAGNAGARTEGEIAQRRRPHSVTSLWRWAWHSMVTAPGREVMCQGQGRMWMPKDVVSPP